MARFAQIQAVTSGSMTGTAVITSTPTDTASMIFCSYTFIWTGTPTGAFTFEVSNNYDRIATTGTWVTWAPAVAPADPAGSATSTSVNLANFPYRWVRFKYTNASGTGTLNAWFFGKGG